MRERGLLLAHRVRERESDLSSGMGIVIMHRTRMSYLSANLKQSWMGSNTHDNVYGTINKNKRELIFFISPVLPAELIDSTACNILAQSV